MFVAKFRSIGGAAIQAGNSESIRKHYLDLKTTKEAGQLLVAERKRVFHTMDAGAWLLWLKVNFRGPPGRPSATCVSRTASPMRRFCRA
jgi:hypothetical protein